MIWFTDDLLKLPHEFSTDRTGARGEGPTESPDVELVEEIIKKIRG